MNETINVETEITEAVKKTFAHVKAPDTILQEVTARLLGADATHQDGLKNGTERNGKNR